MKTEIMECHNGCKDPFWVSWMKKDVCVHEVLEESPVALTVRCDTCGVKTIRSTDEAEEKIYCGSGYLTKYPRVEPHTGKLVKSKTHELETVKRMGYAPVKGS